MTLITKKHTLWLYLSVYMQFSQRTLFTKATPTILTIRHDFNCHINERETPTTCLTNHKSSISHHTMPLVINSLGGRYTHTHTHTHTNKYTTYNDNDITDRDLKHLYSQLCKLSVSYFKCYQITVTVKTNSLLRLLQNKKKLHCVHHQSI